LAGDGFLHEQQDLLTEYFISWHQSTKPTGYQLGSGSSRTGVRATAATGATAAIANPTA
jgi:hypothetical protein